MPSNEAITPRELEILRLLGEGLSDRQIASRLGLKGETVRWYNKRLYKRLGVTTRIQAVRVGISQGLLSSAVPAPPKRTVERSPIRYLRRSDGPAIAYQVVGSGPVDLVLIQSYISNLEVEWDEPECAAFFESLASQCRLILFDRRGVGLSDRTDQPTTIHETADDVHAILKAEGSNRAFILASSEGGAASLLLASSDPALVQGLILFGSTPKLVHTDADSQWARDPERFRERADAMVDTWGGPWAIADFAPSRAHEPAFRDWWARMLRASSSPSGIRRIMDAAMHTDVRSLLPHVRVRTLVLHRRGDRIVSVAAGRYIAERMPNARFIELAGDDHMVFIDSARIVEAVHAFLREPSLPTSESWIGVVLASVGSGSALDVTKRAILTSAAPRRLDEIPGGWFAVLDSPQRARHAAEQLVALGRGRCGAMALHVGACDRQSDLPSAPVLESALSLAKAAAPLELRVSPALQALWPEG